MTARSRSIAIVVAVLVGVGGIAVYALRDRVGNVPYVNRLLGSSTATSAPTSSTVPTSGTPSGSPSDGSANHPESTPRGDVTIDPRRQQLIGVRTVAATRSALSATIRTVGAVRYDETRLADVNLKVEGFIRELFVDYTGQAITKGQPLFTLYSPDVLTTENEYLLAVKTRERVQQSQLPDARERADQLIASARERLAQ